MNCRNRFISAFITQNFQSQWKMKKSAASCVSFMGISNTYWMNWIKWVGEVGRTYVTFLYTDREPWSDLSSKNLLNPFSHLIGEKKQSFDCIESSCRNQKCIAERTSDCFDFFFNSIAMAFPSKVKLHIYVFQLLWIERFQVPAAKMQLTYHFQSEDVEHLKHIWLNRFFER